VTTTAGEAVTGGFAVRDDRGATVDVGGQVREVPYDSVARARIQIELNKKGS
jgi:hypothetical protein